MPVYVYGCDNQEHPREEIALSIHDNNTVLVCDECASFMHRIPQPLLTFYHNPSLTLRDHLNYWYCQKRGGKPVGDRKYNIMRPDHPYPQRHFDTRRYKKNGRKSTTN